MRELAVVLSVAAGIAGFRPSTIQASDDSAPRVPGTVQPRLRGGRLQSPSGRGFSRELHAPEVAQTRQVPIHRSESPAQAAPRLFERPPIEPGSLALLTSQPAEVPDVKPSWKTRLDQISSRTAIVLIVCIFLVVYLVLAYALKRGPVSRGLTHD